MGSKNLWDVPLTLKDASTLLCMFLCFCLSKLLLCSTGVSLLIKELLKGRWRVYPPLSSQPPAFLSECAQLSSSCCSPEVEKSQHPGHIQSALSVPMITSLKHHRMPFLWPPNLWCFPPTLSPCSDPFFPLSITPHFSVEPLRRAGHCVGC